MMVFTMLSVFLFFLFAAFTVTMLIRGLGQWNRPRGSPRLTVRAVVAGRRQKRETYYVTFQVDSGDRLELAVDATEYGQLTEGDAGQLTFQGTRYLAFVRNGQEENV
ncbi:MAG: DUF2500 domain-containing protein [Oscillibacter sp.]|nr:DUF2500 domain-containing protein [Oscillibacter sp.]